MELIFNTSKLDYQHFYKQYYKKKVREKIILLIIMSFILGTMFAGTPFHWLYFFIGIIGSFIALVFITYQIPYRKSISWLNQIIFNDPGILGKQKISLTENGLMLENPTKNGIWNWESIYSVYVGERYIYILFFNDRKILIPKTAFTTNEEISHFYDTIQHHRTRTSQPISQSVPLH